VTMIADTIKTATIVKVRDLPSGVGRLRHPAILLYLKAQSKEAPSTAMPHRPALIEALLQGKRTPLRLAPRVRKTQSAPLSRAHRIHAGGGRDVVRFEGEEKLAVVPAMAIFFNIALSTANLCL
jgi:hypothetical protein